MPTFRDVILGPLDIVRGVGGLLGLRVFVVTVRVRTSDGERPGVGGWTDVDTVLTNALPGGGSTNVHVRQLSRREVIASGGLYSDRDLRVGPITPPYPAGFSFPAGGFDDATMNFTPPPRRPATTEIFWNVAGLNEQGYPSGGSWFNLVGQEFTALHAYVILRANGTVP